MQLEIDHEKLNTFGWYEKSIFLEVNKIGQRKLSRMTGIHLQAIHRVYNKVLLEVIKCD